MSIRQGLLQWYVVVFFVYSHGLNILDKTKNSEPLFFPESSDTRNDSLQTPPHSPAYHDDAFNRIEEDDDECSLDYDRFDILPAMSMPALTTSAMPSGTSDISQFSSQLRIETGSSPVKLNATLPLEAVLSVTESCDDDEDPLADFNAWVQGGGVIILPES
jgi:hypothetical protein